MSSNCYGEIHIDNYNYRDKDELDTPLRNDKPEFVFPRSIRIGENVKANQMAFTNALNYLLSFAYPNEINADIHHHNPEEIDLGGNTVKIDSGKNDNGDGGGSFIAPTHYPIPQGIMGTEGFMATFRGLFNRDHAPHRKVDGATASIHLWEEVDVHGVDNADHNENDPIVRDGHSSSAYEFESEFEFDLTVPEAQHATSDSGSAVFDYDADTESDSDSNDPDECNVHTSVDSSDTGNGNEDDSPFPFNFTAGLTFTTSTTSSGSSITTPPDDGDAHDNSDEAAETDSEEDAAQPGNKWDIFCRGGWEDDSDGFADSDSDSDEDHYHHHHHDQDDDPDSGFFASRWLIQMVTTNPFDTATPVSSATSSRRLRIKAVQFNTPVEEDNRPHLLTHLFGQSADIEDYDHNPVRIWLTDLVDRLPPIPEEAEGGEGTEQVVGYAREYGLA
ncbi:hypothetical protein CI109_103274 [Kwoniella shandongensis]|uniref:Uncharacterized protein n=1 Tax=Kwoniella shandongensis TaxID=1734106 RepID=A0A5M6BS16_9TREE|nr:uncharacterized protein CI109_006054 [Kwoniella shandongensis]KAA5525603.1 hypothetical protein CI109_006054 [Kwoniella shandongensis]